MLNSIVGGVVAVETWVCLGGNCLFRDNSDILKGL